MRIALVVPRNPSIPAAGGAEAHYDGLEVTLRERGHEVERIQLDSDESTFEGILEGYRAAKALDLSPYDAVLSTKAPTYAVSHPRHVVHLIHTIRVFYDLFDSWTDGSRDCQIKRDRIHQLDFEALSAIPEHRRFTNGEEVAKRLWAFLGLRATAVHPALLDAPSFHDGIGEHFLFVSRLHRWKRADLVVKAYLALSSKAPLLVVGTGPEEADLRALARGHPRVRFLSGVKREDLFELYSRAIAVLFAPIMEDFGYVTLEAGLSSKPVVTATDSGEVARIVHRERSGLVAEPNPGALAQAMGSLLGDLEAARLMGSRGRAFATRVTWPAAVDHLLGSLRKAGSPSPAAPLSRTRVLVVDNQPIEPPVGGGRLRLHGLYSNLPDHLDPVYVGTYDWRGPGYRAVRHGDSLVEITVPQSEEHFVAHEVLCRQESALTMDVTFPAVASLSTAFGDRVAYEAREADVVVVSHPWAYPVVAARAAEACKRRLVYDAHNVEARLRRDLLPRSPVGDAIAALAEDVERELCQRSDMVLACSEEDAAEFQQRFGIPRSRLRVVPNGVDSRALKPATASTRAAARCRLGLGDDEIVSVFVGSHYPPNVDATRFICERLAPALPDVRFLIVGGCSLDLLEDGVPANVILLGAVDDELRNAAYAASDIAVNPMSQGSGTNIKMLDFFAAGLPVVTTEVGARGLADGLGSAFLAVSRNGEFVAAVRKMCDDSDLRSRMAAAGRALAEGRYDWRKVASDAAAAIRSGPLREDAHPGVAAGSTPDDQPRVAILSTWKTKCGIADYTAFLVSGLPPSAPWIIYAESRSCGVPEGPQVRRNWEIGLRDMSRLAADLSKDRIDLLLVQHNPGFMGEAALFNLFELCHSLGVKVAVTFHAARALGLHPAFVAALKRAARVFVHRISDAACLAEAGLDRNVAVMRQGILRFPRRDRLQLKRGLGLEGKLLIGHFGFLRPHKGTIEVIDAFEWLAARRPDVDLVLSCSEYPSPDSASYRRLCDVRLQASPFRTRIHACFDHLPVEDIGVLLQACDVTVFPYRTSLESSSAAVRFAVAAGRPVVVSESEIFEELRGISVVAPSTAPEALSDTLASLLDDPKALREGEARVERLARESDWSVVGARTWGVIRAALSEFENARGGAIPLCG